MTTWPPALLSVSADSLVSLAVLLPLAGPGRFSVDRFVFGVDEEI